ERRWRTDCARLAAALDAKRIAWAGRVLVREVEGRKVVRARHGIVHIARGEQLAAFPVIAHFFEQRLPNSLRQPPMHLPLDDQRVDDIAEIVCRDELYDLRLARLRIDLDLRDVAAGREGEVCRIV